MYGQRGRIGLIVPSSNTVCEPEFRRLCPQGVEPYATRILFEPSPAGLRGMREEVGRAARELGSEGICGVLVFCCTVGSMIGGPAYDAELSSVMEKAAGAPALTITTAVRAALRVLGARRIAVATPYTEEINALERCLLEAMGCQVTAMKGVHEHVAPKEFTNEMIGRLEPGTALEVARAVDGPAAEAIFISCTNFRTIEIIQDLERETGKPVITSNQAGAWAAIRHLGLGHAPRPFGRLFTLPWPDDTQGEAGPDGVKNPW